ncbi:MAG TPA: GrpB family protein [Bryobacteraceae bacterium]|jgi:GrpB-like predicted nucleotidyltransferase (UPF0157 family)|nr:GrpB family protein [Bryobacteraceae bacterium]
MSWSAQGKVAGESWRGSLAFRDALRRDAGLRERYAQEKERAAAAAPENRPRYNLQKSPFIAESMQKAFGGPDGQ